MEVEKVEIARMRTENEFKSGANWFYWIAAMSIVNEVLLQTHSGWNFAIGLGITQIISVLFRNSVVSSVATFILSGIFLFFGKMAHQGRKWAFITGIILYTLDGIIFIIFKDYIGLGLHIFALYCIYQGMRAYKKLIDINNNQALKTSASEEGVSV